MSNNLSYLLVRSNPQKKDSIHYGRGGLRDALCLQGWLKFKGENTELYVIDVERGLCTLVTTYPAD